MCDSVEELPPLLTDDPPPLVPLDDRVGAAEAGPAQPLVGAGAGWVAAAVGDSETSEVGISSDHCPPLDAMVVAADSVVGGGVFSSRDSIPAHCPLGSMELPVDRAVCNGASSTRDSVPAH